MSLNEQLPKFIEDKLMSLLQKVDGEYEVIDMLGLIKLVSEHCKEYPSLKELLQIDEEEVVKLYEETGVVIPGIKLVETSTTEGSNVTSINIIHGKVSE